MSGGTSRGISKDFLNDGDISRELLRQSSDEVPGKPAESPTRELSEKFHGRFSI